MCATIIVRRIRDNRTVKLVELTSLDELTVRETLTNLKETYSADDYRIDLSQVYWARKAAAEQVAA